MKLRGYVTVNDFSREARDMLLSIMALDVRSETDALCEQELMRFACEYDVLVIGTSERLTQGVYRSARRLRAVGTLSAGVDHIDRAFIDDPRFAVFTAPTGNTVSVAEHTYALLLAIAKQLFQGHEAVMSGRGLGGISSFPTELAGRVLGVIGAGNVGAKVIRMARTFGLSVLCFTYHPERHKDLHDCGAVFVPLEDLLGQADVVSLHLPLTSASRHLISAERIAMMKDNAVFISTSRSLLVDNRALSEALANGRIRGAGLDSVDENDIGMFRSLPNVVVTPHIAGLTPAAIARTDMELAHQLVRYVGLLDKDAANG